MYGVIAVFDDETDKAICEVWQELKEHSISFYAQEVINRIPHITLASYEYLEEDSFIKRMEEVYSAEKSVEIHFNALGSFFKSGALYLSPVFTKGLNDLHSSHHHSFTEWDAFSSSLYSPDKWIPHCTLANRLSLEKLSEAYAYCLGRFETISGKITGIALVKLNGNTAPVIHRVQLK
ncbi:2'-5' RNA ligase family protein [Bacillus sp. SCS-153A]|uniref:2'-5' RNA ligase family protein n=1 Tax=Rossellomorea sedimentorum TaxID=3115294 RepID=UPI0039059739